MRQLRLFRASSMAGGFLLVLSWSFLLQILLILILTPGPLPSVEGFVTVPAEVAFAVITAAVKMKLVLVKVLFALRTIGLLRNRRTNFGHGYRHRNRRSIDVSSPSRSSGLYVYDGEKDVDVDPFDPELTLHKQKQKQKYKHAKVNSIIEDSHAELMAAWAQLEVAADQKVRFDLSYCRLGVLAPNSVGSAPTEQLREYRDKSGGGSGIVTKKRRRMKRSARLLLRRTRTKPEPEPQFVSLLTPEEEAGTTTLAEAEGKKDSDENLMLFFDSKEETQNLDREDTEPDSSKSEEQLYDLVYDDGGGDEEEEDYDYIDYEADDLDEPQPQQESRSTKPVPSKIQKSRTIEVSVSEFISATIGSMMGDMHGCEILEQGLKDDKYL